MKENGNVLVKLNVQVIYRGLRRLKGEELEVPPSVADRWVTYNLATLVKPPTKAKAVKKVKEPDFEFDD